MTEDGWDRRATVRRALTGGWRDGNWYPPQPLQQSAPPPLGQPPQRVVQQHVVIANTGCLGVAGNLVWFVFVGWWRALSYLVAAALMFLLIVTIPFGVQSAAGCSRSTT